MSDRAKLFIVYVAGLLAVAAVVTFDSYRDRVADIDNSRAACDRSNPRNQGALDFLLSSAEFRRASGEIELAEESEFLADQQVEAIDPELLVAPAYVKYPMFPKDRPSATIDCVKAYPSPGLF